MDEEEEKLMRAAMKSAKQEMEEMVKKAARVVESETERAAKGKAGGEAKEELITDAEVAAAPPGMQEKLLQKQFGRPRIQQNSGLQEKLLFLDPDGSGPGMAQNPALGQEKPESMKTGRIQKEY